MFMNIDQIKSKRAIDITGAEMAFMIDKIVGDHLAPITDKIYRDEARDIIGCTESHFSTLINQYKVITAYRIGGETLFSRKQCKDYAQNKGRGNRV